MLPKSRTTFVSRSENEFVEEFQNTGSIQIAAAATQYADTIRKVAERSKNLKGTCIKELKEAAAAVTAAVETLAKRAQLPQAEAVEEEMEKFRKEIRDLKYNNKKMQAQLAQCQKELRERDEFPVILPSLAARKETVKRKEVPRERSPAPTTEMDTSVGPSDWDDVSGLVTDELRRPETENEVAENIEEMDIVEDSMMERMEKEEGRRRIMEKRGEPQARAPPPTSMPPPPQGKRKEKGRKDKNEDIEKRLE